jgi:hypothetical protein
MSDDARELAEPREPASNAAQRRPAHRTAIITGAVIVLAAIGFGLFAMFVPLPQVPAGMLTATAGEDGQGGYHQEGETTDNPLVAATATSLASRVGETASTATIHSDGDRLFDRTVAIRNLDDGLVMQRIGLALYENLRDTGRFQEVRYLPAGETPPTGARLPEVFITLDNTQWNQSGLPGKRRYKGTFLVTACDRIVRSSHGHHGTSSPPQLQFRWRAEIDYTAEQTGIETSGARYQALSRDLAGEIAERVTKVLDDAADKHGTVGDVPESLYPQYVPPPQFDFLSELGLEKLIDGSALMRPTVTVWQTSEERIPGDVVAHVRDALDAGGWKVPEKQEDLEHLRAWSADQVLEVFRQNDGWNPGDRDADSKERVFIVYTRSMSTDDIDDALEQMFADGVDERVLLMFRSHWYRHRDAVEAYFRERTPTEAASWLQLAQFRRKSDPEAAREALLRANALRWIFDQQAPDSSMKKLAEELGLEGLSQGVSQEMIETLAVARLDSAGEQTLTAHEDTPVAVWLGETDDRQIWLLLTLRSRGTRTGLELQVNRVEVGDGAWSRSEQTLTKPDPSAVWEHRHHIGGGEAIEISCEPAEDGRAYRLTLRRTVPAE